MRGWQPTPLLEKQNKPSRASPETTSRRVTMCSCFVG